MGANQNLTWNQQNGSMLNEYWLPAPPGGTGGSPGSL
jgi:hypothetical protein